MLKRISKTNFKPFYAIFRLILGCIFVSTNKNNYFYLNITSDHILEIVSEDYTNLLEIQEKFQIDTTNDPKKERTATFSWSTWGVNQYLSSLSFDYTINNNKLHLKKCRMQMTQIWRTSYMYFEIKKKITVDLNKMSEHNGNNSPFNKIQSTDYNNVYLIIKSYSIKFSPCIIKATTVAITVPTSSRTSIKTSTKKPETKTKSETANEEKSETKSERTSRKKTETKWKTTCAKKTKTKSVPTNKITTETKSQSTSGTKTGTKSEETETKPESTSGTKTGTKSEATETKSETTSGTKTGTKSEKTNETKTEAKTKNVKINHVNDNTSYTALKMILILIVITGMLLIPIILFSLKKYKQNRVVTSGSNTAQNA